MHVSAVETKRGPILERVFLCMIAIALLWLTSLGATQYIIQRFLATPPSSIAIEGADQLTKIIQDESNRYVTCMNSRLQACQSQSKVDGDREAEHIEQIKSQNTDTMQTLAAESTQCQEETLQAFLTLNELLNTGYLGNENHSEIRTLADALQDGANERPSCEALDQVASRLLAGRNTISLANNYQTGIADRLGAITDNVRALSDYDQAYMDEMKAQSEEMRQSLKDSAEALGRTLDKIPDKMNGLSDLASDTVDAMGSATTWATDKFSDLKDDYQDIQRRADDFYDNMIDMQESFEAFMDNPLVSVVKFLVGVPSIDVDTAFKETVMAHLKNSIPFSEYETRMKAMTNNAALYAEAESLKLLRETQALIDKQKQDSDNQASDDGDAVTTWFDDYQPPDGIDVNRELESFENETNDFIDELTATVNGLGGIKTNLSIPDVNVSDGWDALGDLDTSSSLLDSFMPSEWYITMFDNIQIANIFQSFTDISLMAHTGDILFRVASTLQLIRKYMRMSKTVTPPVDLRSMSQQRVDGAYGGQKSAMPAYHKAALILLHPVTIGLAIMAILWVILTIFLALYIPFFETYTETCVAVSDPNPDVQTIIWANMHTFATEISQQDGNTIAAKGIGILNVLNQQQCLERTADFKKQYIEQLGVFELSRNGMNVARNDMQSLKDCLKIDELNIVLQSRVEYNTCFQSVEGSSLNPLQFNCTSLYPCPMACPKPNSARLEFATWYSACTAEAYIHGIIFSTIFGFLIYTVTNVSRILFVTGLKYFLWKSLSSNMFSYIATCEIDVESSRDSLETLKEIEERAKEEVARALTKYRRKGALLMLLSILILVPCAVIFVIVSKKLTISH